MNYAMIALIGFISFAMELLATKVLLPGLGGSAAVWIGSLLFFQASLFFSYGLTYFVIKGSKTRLTLLIVISFIINGYGIINNIQITQFNPLLSLIMTLSMQFGLIFISLLAISPYLQIKTSGRSLDFYVFSNVGSLLGLLSYPFLIEPLIGLWWQKTLLLIFSGIIFLWFIVKATNQKTEPLVKLSNKEISKILLWSSLGTILLGCLSSALIQDIVSFPLLWVAPLMVYLLSFIWAFSSKPIGWSLVDKNGAVILQMICLFLIAGIRASNWSNIVLSLILFFMVMIIVQFYLASQAPVEKNKLPAFYYWVGLGGLIGGLVVNLLVPLVFIGVNEYIFFLIVVLFLIVKKTDKTITGYVAYGLIAVIFAITQIYQSSLVLEYKRSFYGLIKVFDYENTRTMMHGHIIHGQENLKNPTQPNTYYQKEMIGDLFESKPKKIAIIGLGAGVILSYVNPQMQVDVYEIDPLVVELARKHFSYIKSSPQVNIIIGDGRQLIKESKEVYDLIIVDAFSGDSIPVHLLTVEAMRIYNTKLSPEGVLALHLSNNYLNLSQAVIPTALESGFTGDVQTILANKVTAYWGKFTKFENINIIKNPQVWTDDYSSLLKIIK